MVPGSEDMDRPRRSTNHCCVLVSGRIDDRGAEEEVTVAAADAARELIPVAPPAKGGPEAVVAELAEPLEATARFAAPVDDVEVDAVEAICAAASLARRARVELSIGT